MAKGNSVVSISKNEQSDRRLQSEKSLHWFMTNAQHQGPARLSTEHFTLTGLSLVSVRVPVLKVYQNGGRPDLQVSSAPGGPIKETVSLRD